MRSVLLNEASLVAMFLTTEAVVANLPEENTRGIPNMIYDSFCGVDPFKNQYR